MISQTIKAKRADVIRATVAAYLHECTKAGKRVTIAEIADFHGYHKAQVLTALRLLQHHAQPTKYGFVKVVEAGQRTGANGVTAMTYAGILNHEKPPTNDTKPNRPL